MSNDYNYTMDNYEPDPKRRRVNELSSNNNEIPTISNQILIQQSINYIGNLTMELLNKVNQIMEKIDNSSKNENNIEKRLMQIDNKIDSLTKEINDLQIHALHNDFNINMDPHMNHNMHSQYEESHLCDHIYA